MTSIIYGIFPAVQRGLNIFRWPSTRTCIAGRAAPTHDDGAKFPHLLRAPHGHRSDPSSSTLVHGPLCPGADRDRARHRWSAISIPDLGKALKPLGDGFIALIKMMIAPVIFCTVVHGIASMGDLKKVGRVGVKTLFYFEVVSTARARRSACWSARCCSPAPASTSIRPRSIRRRWRATSPAPRKRASSRICWRSFPTASSARSPAATCCRCCWSRS